MYYSYLAMEIKASLTALFLKLLCLVLLQSSLSLATLLSAQWQSLEDHFRFKLHFIFKVVPKSN